MLSACTRVSGAAAGLVGAAFVGATSCSSIACRAGNPTSSPMDGASVRATSSACACVSDVSREATLAAAASEPGGKPLGVRCARSATHGGVCGAAWLRAASRAVRGCWPSVNCSLFGSAAFSGAVAGALLLARRSPALPASPQAAGGLTTPWPAGTVSASSIDCRDCSCELSRLKWQLCSSALALVGACAPRCCGLAAASEPVTLPCAVRLSSMDCNDCSCAALALPCAVSVSSMDCKGNNAAPACPLDESSSTAASPSDALRSCKELSTDCSVHSRSLLTLPSARSPSSLDCSAGSDAEAPLQRSSGAAADAAKLPCWSASACIETPAPPGRAVSRSSIDCSDCSMGASPAANTPDAPCVDKLCPVPATDAASPVAAAVDLHGCRCGAQELLCTRRLSSID